jgi:hypothetical protein
VGVRNRLRNLEDDLPPKLCEENPPCEDAIAWGREGDDGVIEWEDGRAPRDRCAQCPVKNDRPAAIELHRVKPEAYEEGSPGRIEAERRREERILRSLNARLGSGIPDEDIGKETPGNLPPEPTPPRTPAKPEKKRLRPRYSIPSDQPPGGSGPRDWGF